MTHSNLWIDGKSGASNICTTQTQGCVLCICLFSCIVSDVLSVDLAAEAMMVEDEVDLLSKDTKTGITST